MLVPLQCEFFALEGLSLLLRTIERVRGSFNPMLQIHGVVLTMFDRRNNLSEQVASDVRSFMGDRVYDTIIPRNVRVSEAPSHGGPVLLYDFKSVGAQAYAHLAGEMLRRERRLEARMTAERRQRRGGAGSAWVCRRCSAAMPDDLRRRGSRRARRNVPIEFLRPSPLQPRRRFDEVELEALAAIDPRARHPAAAAGATGPRRRRRLSRSSPASGVGARPSWRACTRCRWSCASCPTRRRSSWR